MASTERMPDRTGPGGRRKPTVWRARYRDEAGKEHAGHVTRQADAQRWLDEVSAALVTGQYVDPNAGRATFAAYFDEWASRQVWESTTDLAVRLAARSVTFADVPLARLRRSHLEGWVKAMSVAGLAPGTIRTRTNNVRAVLRGAIRDRVMASDTSDGLTLSRDRRREAAMALPGAEQVAAVLEPRLPRSGRSSPWPLSRDCGSARPPPCRSATSTSCAAGSTFADRCSARAAVRPRCGRPSTAASGPCSRPTPCSSCRQSTSHSTGRAATRRAGCS